MAPVMFDVPAIPLIRPGIPVAAFRYYPEIGYEPLPRVKALEVTAREGADSSKAIFQYVSGSTHIDVNPITFADVLPLVRVGNPDVVEIDDRIVVAGLTPTGRLRFLFDGFAQVPESKFSGGGETLTFSAQGVEYRCWDDVLSGQVMRDAGDPTNPERDRWIDLPLRFNPKITAIGPGQTPNQLADGFESSDDEGNLFSPFVDPFAARKTVAVKGNDVKIGQMWNLFTAVIYMMVIGNRNGRHVRVQNRDYLSRLLSVLVPKVGDFYDPDDETTYDVRPIVIPDTDVEGEAWPDAVEKLVGAFGYAMCFRLGDDGENPVTWLEIYKLNDPARSRYKDLYMQPYGDALDPGATNLGSARFAHDTSNVVNVVSVSTAPVRYEVGVVLAPMFIPDQGDVESTEAKQKFDTKNPDFAKNRNKYRLFAFDEAGEGHARVTYAGSADQNRFDAFDWVKDIAPLESVFGADDKGVPRYAERRRPAFNTLWTKDEAGDPIKAELYVSADYQGPVPCVWDGYSGTWFKVKGDYSVCDDRLGIRIDYHDPNAFNVGKPLKGAKVPTGPFAGGEMRIMEWMCHADQDKRKAFAFMLVCVIEGDQHLGVIAPRRGVSPTKFEVRRIIDLRSKLRPGEIHPSSYHHPDKGVFDAKPIVVGDEEERALDYAIGKRESRQLGAWSGSALIPRLSNAYIIGDRIRSIVGRDVSLQTNLDANGREAPVYPRVIGVTWKLSDAQTTSLILTDKRADYGGNV